MMIIVNSPSIPTNSRRWLVVTQVISPFFFFKRLFYSRGCEEAGLSWVVEVSPAEPTKSVFEKRKMEGRHKEPPGSTLKEVDALDMTAHERQHISLWGFHEKIEDWGWYHDWNFVPPHPKIWKITHQISRNLRHQVSSTLDFVELGTPSLLRTTWFAGLARWSQFFAGFWELRPTKTNCKFNVNP